MTFMSSSEVPMIKLLLGDSLKMLKDISTESIDLIVTDCPYSVVQGGRTGNKTPKGGIFSSQHEQFKKGKVFDNNNMDFNDWLPDLFRVLKNKSHCYIMINGRNLKVLQTKAENSGFTYQNLLVWDKGNKTPNRYYMQQLEFILMLTKRGSRDINNMGQGNLLSIKNEVGNKLHPTEKPVSLIKLLISNSSNEGDIILDPFMGSGSAAVACNELNRSFIGMEIESKYYSAALEKIYGGI